MHSIYKIRLGGLGWLIHIQSSTEPYLNSSGSLTWTPINDADSDVILKIDWNQVTTISYRKTEIKDEIVEPSIDLNNLKTFEGKDNKKYVLLNDVKALIFRKNA